MINAESPSQLMSLTVEQALQQAVAHHQLGQVQDAERLYRAILQAQPNHPDASHYLGVLAVQAKQPAVALSLFKVALDANPNQIQYWLSYIDALIQTDQKNVARQMLAQARQLKLNAEAVEALAGRLGEPSRNEPDPQEIRTLVALFAAGRYAEAVTLAQTMTTRFPLHGYGWKALGVVFTHMGKSADALALLQKAVALSPNDAEAHSNLGNTLHEQGRLAEAESSCRRALQIKPDYADAHINLGNTLQEQGRLVEAEASYRRALEIKQDIAEAHSNLGNTLQEQGRLVEAEASCRRSLLIKPDHAEAHMNLGNTLQEQGRLVEAEASYRRVLAIKPDFAEAHSNLGTTLKDLGRLVEAQTSYRRALQIKPNYAEAHSNLLFCLAHDPGISPEQVFAEHRAFGDRFEAPFLGRWPHHRNLPDSARTLRVGFVSADLRTHPVSLFIAPLWAALDSKQVEIWAYSNHFLEDEVTLRLKGLAHRWRKVVGVSDEELADQIRQDRIDILFDLSGHTRRNRLLTFARKPAPIQVTWIGIPNTTGLKAMDYYLADRFSAPSGLLDALFTEKIVRLPSGALFQPLDRAPAVSGLPALESGALTFGSFNRSDKLAEGVVALWSRVLNAIPSSRILLGGLSDVSRKENLTEKFARNGVNRERVVFHPRVGMTEYLALHHQVDLILDTFPFSGGTTSCHAAWMGVPVLTLAGKTMSSRVGVIINSNLGLPEFITESEDAFVTQAVRWSQRLSELAVLRDGLRSQMLASPLCQTQAVAQWLELALRAMWLRWCEGKTPESFGINP